TMTLASSIWKPVATAWKAWSKSFVQTSNTTPRGSPEARSWYLVGATRGGGGAGSATSSRRRPGVAWRASSCTGSCAGGKAALSSKHHVNPIRRNIMPSLQFQRCGHGRYAIRIEDKQHIMTGWRQVGIGRCLHIEGTADSGER